MLYIGDANIYSRTSSSDFRNILYKLPRSREMIRLVRQSVYYRFAAEAGASGSELLGRNSID